MTVDAAAVSALLRQEVRPALRASGFTEFAGRKAWAGVGDAVWCVSMPSFGAYAAAAVGCTTASFQIDLGVHFHRPGSAPATGTGRPHEAACVFRFTCTTQRRQPWFHAYGRANAEERSDVWFVQVDGSNLAEVVVAPHGSPRWYERVALVSSLL